MFKDNNKDARTTPYSNVSIVNFEQVSSHRNGFIKTRFY